MSRLQNREVGRGLYLSSGTLGRRSRQGAGRDEGASGSRKCQREGEPFQGEDAGSVGVGKKRKTKSVGGRYRGLQSAGELSRAVETGKNKCRKDRGQGGGRGRARQRKARWRPNLGLCLCLWEMREEPAFRTVAGSMVMPSYWAYSF